MLATMDKGANLSSLRAAVSAGETLPAPVYEAWLAKTGKPMLDGIGSTEMLHIFISNRLRRFSTGLHRQILEVDGINLGACTQRAAADRRRM